MFDVTIKCYIYADYIHLKDPKHSSVVAYYQHRRFKYIHKYMLMPAEVFQGETLFSRPELKRHMIGYSSSVSLSEL